MLYVIIDGMGNVVDYFEADNEVDARQQFQNWIDENADEDAGPLDFYYELADDDAEIGEESSENASFRRHYERQSVNR